jgi:hypothetical protein
MFRFGFFTFDRFDFTLFPLCQDKDFVQYRVDPNTEPPRLLAA